ncbi:hypothetical protein BKA70DRAFT_1221713 [Coprinopsis sp. MPI-PUGE-AT-0042]|nr:hypothetical protein BKA70DRAFT_1221713 [Coprinopsis sp. MPI-PUGE-AT-0042]
MTTKVGEQQSHLEGREERKSACCKRMCENRKKKDFTSTNNTTYLEKGTGNPSRNQSIREVFCTRAAWSPLRGPARIPRQGGTGRFSVPIPGTTYVHAIPWFYRWCTNQTPAPQLKPAQLAMHHEENRQEQFEVFLQHMKVEGRVCIYGSLQQRWHTRSKQPDQISQGEVKGVARNQIYSELRRQTMEKAWNTRDLCVPARTPQLPAQLGGKLGEVDKRAPVRMVQTALVQGDSPDESGKGRVHASGLGSFEAIRAACGQGYEGLEALLQLTEVEVRLCISGKCSSRDLDSRVSIEWRDRKVVSLTMLSCSESLKASHEKGTVRNAAYSALRTTYHSDVLAMQLTRTRQASQHATMRDRRQCHSPGSQSSLKAKHDMKGKQKSDQSTARRAANEERHTTEMSRLSWLEGILRHTTVQGHAFIYGSRYLDSRVSRSNNQTEDESLEARNDERIVRRATRGKLEGFLRHTVDQGHGSIYGSRDLDSLSRVSHNDNQTEGGIAHQAFSLRISGGEKRQEDSQEGNLEGFLRHTVDQGHGSIYGSRDLDSLSRVSHNDNQTEGGIAHQAFFLRISGGEKRQENSQEGNNGKAEKKVILTKPSSLSKSETPGEISQGRDERQAKKDIPCQETSQLLSYVALTVLKGRGSQTRRREEKGALTSYGGG